MEHKVMDLVHDRSTKIVNTDRISNLPNDIIQHIFSFLDIKHAIQTCTLSRKWKNIWTSVPHLNFSSVFRDVPQFSEFVANVLSRRNNQTEVFTANLRVEGAIELSVKNVINYAYSRNIRQLSMFWFTTSFHMLPPCIFNSHTLKHLNLHTPCAYNLPIKVPKSAWDFPALETLNVSYISFSDDGDGDVDDKSINIFFKCQNLKDLTLHLCSFLGLEVFYICCPQLLNLTITRARVLPKVFNVAAPQLQNVIASVAEYSYRAIIRSTPFQLSTEGLCFLEKVNLSTSKFFSSKYVPALLNLFHTLCSAKYLILEVDIIKTLGSDPDVEKLRHEPCPFKNLKCLKINNVTSAREDNIARIIDRVRNYFLKDNPSASFIID